jgi:hypothetical protein
LLHAALLLNGYRVGANLDFQNGLAALNAVAAMKVSFVDSLAVDKSAIGGMQVPYKTSGRNDLQQTVVARKEPVVLKTEMSCIAAADEECVVLVKRKHASDVWPSQDS